MADVGADNDCGCASFSELGALTQRSGELTTVLARLVCGTWLGVRYERHPSAVGGQLVACLIAQASRAVLAVAGALINEI